MTGNLLIPDAEVMRRHLDLLFSDQISGAIELAWRDSQSKAVDRADNSHGPCSTDQIAGKAQNINRIDGQNVYLGAALRNGLVSTNKRCGDADFLCLTTLYVDLDELGAYENAQEKLKNLPPSFTVITGRHPYVRAQLWWKLEEPIKDPALARTMNARIAHWLDGDKSVVNPGRILRLAGSVAWAVKDGRQHEMTELITPDMPRIYMLEQIERDVPVIPNQHDEVPEKAATPVMRDGLGRVTDGRETFMRDLVSAVFYEDLERHGNSSGTQVLYDKIWPLYEGQVVSRTGNLEAEGRGPTALRKMIERILQRHATGKVRQPDGRSVEFIDNPPQDIMAYSLAVIMADQSLPPPDMVGSRLLTQGGTMVIGGPPKVGKSDFILSFAMHMAAGQDFMNFAIETPLRVFYLQAEIQYPYLKERIQKTTLAREVLEKAGQNLFVTPQLQMILNDEGLAHVIASVRQCFPDAPPDVIIVDPIRNVFDGGPDDGGMGENDNTAMMFFLRERIERLRLALNPKAAVVLVHHTRKLSKQQFREDPFQALSGASSLRGYYTSGVLIYRPDETLAARQLFFELRNGPGIDAFFVDKIDGRWVIVDQNQTRLVRDSYGRKLDAERDRQRDVIVQMLMDEALDGRLYVMEQFCGAFEGKAGLGSHSTIQNRIRVLMTKGHIKSYKAPHPTTGIGTARSKFGYLCVENMMLGPETIDESTGEITRDMTPVKPTHYMHAETGHMLTVENPDVWVYQDEDGGRLESG